VDYINFTPYDAANPAANSPVVFNNSLLLLVECSPYITTYGSVYSGGSYSPRYAF
jgi:hypothetical protein